MCHFTVVKVKRRERIRTVSRLGEQPIVWIDDLIGQDVEPLSDNTLTLEHEVGKKTSIRVRVTR